MLKNLDIRLQKEAESHSKGKYELMAGACYISRERKSERAFECSPTWSPTACRALRHAPAA